MCTFDGIQQVRLVAGDSGFCCVCDIVQVLINVLMSSLCWWAPFVCWLMCWALFVCWLMCWWAPFVCWLMSSLCVLMCWWAPFVCWLMSSLCVLVNVLMSSLCMLMCWLALFVCWLMCWWAHFVCWLMCWWAPFACWLSCQGVVHVSEFVGGGPDPARLRKLQAQVHLWLLPLLLLPPQGKIRWVHQSSYDCSFSS